MIMIGQLRKIDADGIATDRGDNDQSMFILTI